MSSSPLARLNINLRTVAPPVSLRLGAIPRAAKPAKAAAPVKAAAASGGFFGWLKSLFGGGDAPVVTAPPVAAPDAKTAERNEQRPDGRREGSRDSRGRGGRNGNEGRAPREGREGREAGRNTRGGEGRNVEGRPEGRESREGREGARRNEGRVDGRGEARGEPRGESRNGGRRDNRRDAAPLDQTQGTEVLLNAAPAATGETPDMAEGQRRERRPRNDNRRRPQGVEGGEVAQQDGAEGAAQRLEPDARASGAEMPAAEGDADNGGQRAPRERRSRDRYGRDRRERAPRDAAEQSSETEAEPAMSVAPVDEVVTEAPVRSSYFSLPVESNPVAVEEVLAEVAPVVIEPVPVLATPAPRPVAAPEVRKSVPAAAPATRGLPKVEPYTVSIDELNQVAAASGLLSNDSDANNDALTLTSFTVGGTTTTLSSNTGTYTIANAVTITIRSDGSYDFTPASNYNGSLPPITYTVSDGNGGSSTAILSITVTPVNDPPISTNDTSIATSSPRISSSVIRPMLPIRKQSTWLNLPG